MPERHLVSYPKSGRTWLRYALVQLGVAEAVQFQHDGFEFNDGSRPAHDFDLERRIERYAGEQCRVVYLSRDPRDVMVSLYHQVTGRFRDFFHYEGQLSEFIRDDYFGAGNLQRFRSIWDEMCRRGVALPVTYEQCHADMPAVLRRIVDYFGFEVTDRAIVEAVADSSFAIMRSVETAGAFPEPWMRPRNGAFKVRKGRVGSHREELAAADIRYLDRVFGLAE